MKLILLLTLFVLTLLFYNIFSNQTTEISKEKISVPKPAVKKPLKSFTSSKEKKMLDSIAKHSVKIGNGTQKSVYIFVDPLCKFSRKLITNIIDNSLLQKENTYYILLHRLKKYDSDKLMAYILETDDKLSNLEEVMVYGEPFELDDFNPNPNTLKALKEIAQVGDSLDMKLRPYIISFEKGSKYCMVSEGEASCIEDF